MKYEEIITEIKSGRFRPVYFLSGEEPYFIDKIAGAIEESALPGDARALNLVILFGNEVTMAGVLDAARGFPMMSARQVIIVKEAQNIADKEYEKLIPYLDHFQPTTVLAFLYKNKKPDKRKAAFKKLGGAPSCAYLETARLYENEVPAWIAGYCKERQRSISPGAARMLADSLGTDLSKVANELDKLMILLPDGGEIKEYLVEEHTGISKEFNAFELLAAIIKKDHLKANRIVNYFEANPKGNPLVLTISNLFNYFRNLLTYHYQKGATPNQQEMARLLGVHPYFMKDYTEGAGRYGAAKCARVISWLRECDMKSKGSGNISIPEGELLRELVFKIMH
ncbi:MAG: DNA polymerase III subunit delta [Odoribacteraceae bacterium]|jgi:DNA polymerase-3 subunit delta|nr:DNA polymerase III subunit delta [Odoribacteraceae bacterium]